MLFYHCACGGQFAHALSGRPAVRFRTPSSPRSDFLRLLYRACGGQFAHAPCGRPAVRSRTPGGPRSDFLRLLYRACGGQFAHAPSGRPVVRFRKRGGPRSDFLRLLYHGRGGRFCRLLCCPSSGVKKRCAQIFQTCPITSSTGVPVYMALVDSWMR